MMRIFFGIGWIPLWMINAAWDYAHDSLSGYWALGILMLSIGYGIQWVRAHPEEFQGRGRPVERR